MFTFARRVILFFSVSDSVERKQNKRRYTRSPYFVTRARARAREKGEKRAKKRKKRKRMIFARTTNSDDLREQIDRDAFAMRSYVSYMLRQRRRRGGRRRERKRKGKNGNVHYLLK